MSEMTLPYYLPRLEALDLPEYPTAINGQERFLMEPGEKMALLAPGKVGANVRSHLEGVVSSVIPFVMNGYDNAYDPTTRAQNERQLDKILGPLFMVRGTKGGTVRDVSIEAVAPTEVKESMFYSLVPSMRAKASEAFRDQDEPRVFFIIRGLVKVGAYTPTPVGGAVAVFRNDHNHTKRMSPYLYLSPLTGPVAVDWHNRPRVPKKPNPGEAESAS